MPQELGLVARRKSGVPDHVITGNRQEVSRTVEVVGLVELELEIKRLGSFACPSQPVDIGSIRAAEVTAGDHVPLAHRRKG